MKLTRNIAVVLSALAFGAVPAVALASGNTGHGKSTAPGQTKSTSSTSNTTNAKAKMYGKLCATESKKHVAGSTAKGTPFSQCVVAMAQAAKHSHMSASAACKGLSKKHVAGSTSKGTPFSECVVAAAKLRGHK